MEGEARLYGDGQWGCGERKSERAGHGGFTCLRGELGSCPKEGQDE
jgi:hypothetical protein